MEHSQLLENFEADFEKQLDRVEDVRAMAREYERRLYEAEEKFIDDICANINETVLLGKHVEELVKELDKVQRVLNEKHEIVTEACSKIGELSKTAQSLVVQVDNRDLVIEKLSEFLDLISVDDALLSRAGRGDIFSDAFCRDLKALELHHLTLHTPNIRGRAAAAGLVPRTQEAVSAAAARITKALLDEVSTVKGRHRPRSEIETLRACQRRLAAQYPQHITFLARCEPVAYQQFGAAYARAVRAKVEGPLRGTFEDLCRTFEPCPPVRFDAPQYDGPIAGSVIRRQARVLVPFLQHVKTLRAPEAAASGAVWFSALAFNRVQILDETFAEWLHETRTLLSDPPAFCTAFGEPRAQRIRIPRSRRPVHLPLERFVALLCTHFVRVLQPEHAQLATFLREGDLAQQLFDDITGPLFDEIKEALTRRIQGASFASLLLTIAVLEITQAHAETEGFVAFVPFLQRLRVLAWSRCHAFERRVVATVTEMEFDAADSHVERLSAVTAKVAALLHTVTTIGNRLEKPWCDEMARRLYEAIACFFATSTAALGGGVEGSICFANMWSIIARMQERTGTSSDAVLQWVQTVLDGLAARVARSFVKSIFSEICAIEKRCRACDDICEVGRDVFEAAAVHFNENVEAMLGEMDRNMGTIPHALPEFVKAMRREGRSEVARTYSQFFSFAQAFERASDEQFLAEHFAPAQLTTRMRQGA